LKEYKIASSKTEQAVCNEKETAGISTVYCSYNFVPEIYMKRNNAATQM
jgi:hypothetical protein